MRAQWGDTPRACSHFLTSLWEYKEKTVGGLGFHAVMSILCGDDSPVITHHVMFFSSSDSPIKISSN